ncbi:MAG: hemerythrin domain-containing protein [Myxococcales bacterium]|jgi:hypothetical protein
MNTENTGAQILSEHKHLRALLQALEQHLQQPVDSDAWLPRLRNMLSGLVDLCSDHFRLEEETGLHIQLRDQSPRLASRLEQLLSDHSRILDELQKVAADLPTDSVVANEVGPLKERALGALQDIREHERAENEVMMDAYWDDLGGEAG